MNLTNLYTLLPLILIIAVFYFIVIRPQSKRQKEVQEMINQLKVGDEVQTIGGFYAIVYAVDDKNVVLEMLPDYVKTMVVKNAIARVISPEDSLLEDENEPVSDENLDEPEQTDSETHEETDQNINEENKES